MRIKSYLMDLRYYFFECKLRFLMYWIHRKKIILKNKYLIQWDDLTYIHRAGWWDEIDLENLLQELEKLKK